MLTPLKPTGFTVIFACFAFKSSQLFLNSFEDFGCLNVMSCDVSCVDIVIVTCFDGICSVLRLQIVRPTKSSNSNIDRMRTALWPNVNFKSLHEFLHCFCSFLWHMNFELWTPSDLADILFDDQYGRYFFGLFFLSM